MMRVEVKSPISPSVSFSGLNISATLKNSSINSPMGSIFTIDLQKPDWLIDWLISVKCHICNISGIQSQIKARTQQVKERTYQVDLLRLKTCCDLQCWYKNIFIIFIFKSQLPCMTFCVMGFVSTLCPSYVQWHIDFFYTFA